jgi:acetyl esterase
VAAPLHPQIQALVDAGKAGFSASSLADLRAGYLTTAIELGGALEEVARTEDVVIPRPDGGRIRGRAYWPRPCDDPAGLIVWLHGGGWCVGDVEGFDRVSRALANAACSRVLSVDYRLAPEHPFPGPLQDARAALAWARGPGAEQLGHDPARVAVGGDSAGGNLAAVAARHARGDGAPPVRAQLLVYPVTDEGMATYERPSPMLSGEQMASCWRMYRGEHAAGDPDVSPLAAAPADLVRLAPALVLVAGHDILRDEGIAYAEALRAAGVEVELVEYEDMAHGFLRWGGMVDRAHEAVAQVAAFARSRFAL